MQKKHHLADGKVEQAIPVYLLLFSNFASWECKFPLIISKMLQEKIFTGLETRIFFSCSCLQDDSPSGIHYQPDYICFKSQCIVVYSLPFDSVEQNGIKCDENGYNDLMKIGIWKKKILPTV